MTEPIPAGFHWIDGTIIVAYLAVLLGIGFYFSRKQSSLDDFVRGQSRFGGVALGMSLMAALNSGLDYIKTPAVVYNVGLVFIMSGVSWIILYPWISRVTLPFYERLNVYSVYEYLEQRFGLGVRLCAAGIYILWRVSWMGAAIYVPCLAVAAATGGKLDISLTVLVLGSVVTVYTMMGGIKAVIWTDIAQFCVMLGGLAATLWYVVRKVPDGFSEVLRVAADSGRLDLFSPGFSGTGGMWSRLETLLTTEVTFPGIVMMVLLGKAAAFTADQIAIQRFQSAQSLAAARRSYVVSAWTDTVWMVMLGLVGLGLYAYHRHFPYPEGMLTDRILPHFIWQNFPVGVAGLVIAAIFSASLSSVDSALNASASVVVVDFYNRLWLGLRHPPVNLDAAAQRRQLTVSRIATLVLGLVMMAIGANLENMGELFRIAPRILGAFVGPLFGIFVLGMFSRRAHSVGVLVGALAGLATSSFVSFFGRLGWLQEICDQCFGPGFVHFLRGLSWQWPSSAGIAVTLVVGWSVSLLIASRRGDDHPMTFRTVMARGTPST